MQLILGVYSVFKDNAGNSLFLLADQRNL